MVVSDVNHKEIGLELRSSNLKVRNNRGTNRSNLKSSNGRINKRKMGWELEFVVRNILSLEPRVYSQVYNVFYLLQLSHSCK